MPRRSTTYDSTMWKQLREGLLSGVAMLLILGWLPCAVAIALWVVNETGIQVRPKGAEGLGALIYLLPIGVAVAVDEFVVRRIRYGPPCQVGASEALWTLPRCAPWTSASSAEPETVPRDSHPELPSSAADRVAPICR
jgi:hypothetical protein